MTLSLLEILCITIGVAVAVWFWRIRAYAEVAREYAQHYCRQHDLQFISIARKRLVWLAKSEEKAGMIEYAFAFSGDKESAHEGSIFLYKGKVIKVSLPVYRVSNT
ncbi:MAG: DUF3301 domain-containing protein [Glaciecola sp.]|jgi:hypothetical protein